MNTFLRPKSAKLITRFIKPLPEEGLITLPEERLIISALKALTEPPRNKSVQARLINQAEAAEMLSIGLSNFKKLEKEAVFSFKRCIVGSSVRYRNLDVIEFIMNDK